MISPARRICYQALLQVELQGVFSDDALNAGDVSALSLRDRNLVTEILFGTLRWRGWIDHILSGNVRRPWASVAPEIRTLLRMSLYQLMFLSRVPAYAVANDAVNLIKRGRRPGPDKFVNGVLRALLRTQPWRENAVVVACPDWARVSLPRWIWERWQGRFGKAAARSFALSLNTPPPHFVRLTPGGEAQMDCSGAAAAMKPSVLVPGCYIFPTSLRRIPGMDHIHEQDEASQLIPFLLDDIEGKRVWDACAAPGGKTKILRELVGGRGYVIASDLRESRVRRLKELLSIDTRAARCSLVAADASRPPPYLEPFDAVMVDVPCSGLGTMRRNPEIKWRMQESRLPEFHSFQRVVLEHAAAAVKTGGRLLYSTCSTEPEENEDVVHSFLNSNRDFTLVRPMSLPAAAPWIGQDHMFRSYPSERPWDGFFAALMVRKCRT